MSQLFTPRDYQRAIIAHMLQHERCNVWSGMGTGKSVSTLTALQGLSYAADPFPALVLAPLRVASSTWPDEVRKWAHLQGLAVECWAGGKTFTGSRMADVVTINYDNLAELVDYLGDRWPFKTVIADESTRLKGFRVKQGGKRAQAIGKVAHTRVRRWVNLTGTPSPNGLKDLWGQAWFLDAGARLGRSYSAFEDRWFAYKRVKDAISGDVSIQPIIMPFAQEQIENALRDITITVRAQDFLDLPPLIENVIRVELPEKAKRQYRELEREMFLALDHGKNVEAFNAASLTLKCLQLANGALYTDEGADWQEIHDAKIEALRSVVEEANGTPVLVAYHFKSDLARLLRAFPQGRALGTDPAHIALWNTGRLPLLFAHPASAGHGLNLQDGGNILAFFGLWWDLEQHSQIIERIGPTRQAQSGHNRPVYVHRIVAGGTVDETVLRRLQTKASVQDALLEAMKGHP